MYAQDSYGFDLVMVSIFDTQIENCSLYKLIKVGNKVDVIDSDFSTATEKIKKEKTLGIYK